jgi:uncharacterized protein (TIGR02246 family)
MIRRQLLSKIPRLKAVIFMLMFCTATAYSQQECKNAAEDMALRQIADTWKDAYNAGDSSKVAELYTQDAYHLTQHFVTGIVQGRANIQAYVRKGTDAHYHVDKIEVIKTACAGDFAYAISRYESTNAGQKAFGVNLLVLRKIKGKWQIVAHEAAVPDVATAVQSLSPSGN